MESATACQVSTFLAIAFALALAFSLQPANAESISFGYENDRLILGDARRIDDPIPGFVPHRGELQSAVNKNNGSVLFTWSLPNGYSPPQTLIAGQLVSQGLPAGSTQFFDGVLPGYNDSDFSEGSPHVAYNEASNEFLLATLAQRYPAYVNQGAAGRQLNAKGEQISTPFPIHGVGYTQFLQYNPNQDNFVAIGRDWQRQQGVHGAILDATGAVQTELGRLDGPLDDPIERFVTAFSLATASNKYIAVWFQDDTRRSLSAQFIDHLGNRVGDRIPLVQSPDPWRGGYSRVELAYDPELDQFLAAYDTVQGVRGRLIKATGELIGDELILSSLPPVLPGGLIDFSLVYDDVLKRYTLGTILDQKHLELRVFDQDGQLLGYPVKAATADEKMFEIELVSFGAGKFYSAWTTARIFGSSAEIHGKSIQMVPEPTSGLSGLCAVSFLVARRRRNTRQSYFQGDGQLLNSDISS